MWHVRSWLTVAAIVSCLPSGSSSGAEETREARVEQLRLNIPVSWKQQPPANKLRLGQFEIPPVEGDREPAELAIFNFGAGGGVAANRDRWIEQFLPTGREATTTQGKSTSGEYVLVDVRGTYKKPIGPPQAGKTEHVPGSRMLGIMLSVPNDGLYFLKLTGPAKTVTAAGTAFRAAIGGDLKSEQPYDPR